MRKLWLMFALLYALGSLEGLALSTTAAGAGLAPAVADCSAHGTLTRHYSPSELRAALATMPADIAEYTTCPDILRRALLAELGSLKATGSADGGGSFLPAWLIAVVVVLVLAGGAAGAIALRNRQ